MVPTTVTADHRLVFVGGLHRSGTTPLARLLAAHPEISGFSGTEAKEDEGQHLQSVYPSARTYGGAGRFALHPAAHLTEHSDLVTEANARRLLEQWTPYWDLSRRILVEKSPPNLVMTRFLQALYPQARFVVVLRHPLVVALSTSKWRAGVSLETLVENWVVAHETLRADAASVRSLHVLRYEHLVAEPDRALSTLSGFLDVAAPLSSATVRTDRSDAYVERWAGHAASRNPVRRRRAERLCARFEQRVAAFGYSMYAFDVTTSEQLVPGAGPLG